MTQLTQAEFATNTFSAAKDVVLAVVGRQPMTTNEALTYFEQVFTSMVGISAAAVPDQLTAESVVALAEDVAKGLAILAKPEPAVAIEDSVQDDFIICLEDGSKHQMMKRYLGRKFKMTPKQYRERWGLPNDYPMTAPAYSRRKQAEAAKVGLGTVANKMGLNLSEVQAEVAASEEAMPEMVPAA